MSQLPRPTLPCLLLALALAAPAAAGDSPWLHAVMPGDPPAPGEDPLRVGGLLSLEAIDWDDTNRRDEGFDTQTEAASLRLSGMLRGLRVFVDLDLDGEETRHNLREAWGEGRIGEATWLRAGWLRVALGTEFATREEDLPLTGYAYNSWQHARYAPAVQVDGLLSDWLWWQATATAGHASDLAGEAQDEPTLAARLVASAPRGEDGRFTGWYGGVGVAQASDLDGPLRIETPLDQATFSTPDLDGTGRSTLSIEFGYAGEVTRFAFETADTRLDEVSLPGGGEESFDEVGAWTALLAFNLRGRAQAWERGGWQPYRLHAGDELPIELAFRYSNADIDRDLFDLGVATYDPSSQETRTFGASLAAHLAPLTRVSLGWVKVIADQELTELGGTTRDSSFVLRLDQRF